MDNNPVEFFLTSIWTYTDAGVARVLAQLRAASPDGQFAFIHAEGWFSADCRAGDVKRVQQAFRDVHAAMERHRGDSELSYDKPEKKEKAHDHPPGPMLSESNPWLKMPVPGELSGDATAISGTVPAADPAATNGIATPSATHSPVADRLCPIAFDRFAYTRVWTRIKAETPDSVSVQALLSEADRQAIAAVSDTQLAFDTTDRLVYVGGQTRASVDMACRKLDNLFRQFTFIMPPPKHLLYAETEAPFHVDARFMAHVNPAMLTSTIFDPGQYEGVRLDELFKNVFAKAVCLRICVMDHFKHMEVSLFGPRAQPTFYDQARTWPIWFRKAYYMAKLSGTLNVQGTTASCAPGQSKKVKAGALPQAQGMSRNRPAQGNELVHVTRGDRPGDVYAQLDLLTLDGAQDSGKTPTPPPGPVMPPLYASDAHGYQMKLLREFASGTNPNPIMQCHRTEMREEAPQLIDIATEEEADPEKHNTLIEIDTPPPVAPASVASGSKALVRRSPFVTSLCNAIGRLTADLPYRRGRIRLQVETGRLYIMDAHPEGLSTNGPGEPASGWPHAEIVSRLDTVCVSPESIIFTKALTLFANDIEGVLGVSRCGGGNVLESPDWQFHSRRVVYELKCQGYVQQTGSAGMAVQRPFVVEIHAPAEAGGAFTYTLRSVDDARPPIWVHCIQGHWDARVVVTYSATDKLEKAYGEFARELLRSMAVPFQVSYNYCPVAREDGKTTITKVLSARVRNVGRFVSTDKESFLDVSWNRHMALEMRVDKQLGSGSTGAIHATPAADSPVDGQFSSWYEFSVVSAAAEEAFRENETLPAGDVAEWGRDGSSSRVNAGVGTTTGRQDTMFAAAFMPALRLVEKMDSVGVLIDNAQGDGRRWTPPMRRSQMTEEAVKKFW